jgi:hypothetical protein
VVERKEDRSGDGKPDLTAWFKGGKRDRLEQDSGGRGCIDLKQWFDGKDQVSAEYRDTNADCKIDQWSFYENTQLVRLGQDTSGDGNPDALNFIGPDGKATAQEVATGSNGKGPDKKLFLGPGEVVVAQCLLNPQTKKLDTRAVVEGGVVTEVLIDGVGKGVADTREVYQGGQRVRLDADTNADRKPDVIQYFKADAVSRQDEDTNFDGVIDQRFDGGKPASVPAGTRIPGADFGSLGCGSFHGFWKKR